MNDNRRRDPALELLRDLDPKPTLSAQAKRRISDRIDEVVSPSWTRWLLLAAPCAAVLTFLVMRTTRQSTTTASRSEVSQAFIVPACAVTRVADGDQFAAALVGPAEARVSSTSRQSVLLRSGRFIARSNKRPIEVEAPDTRVTIAPSSFAEIHVREWHTVLVALYSGSASVEFTMSKTTLGIAAGNSWRDGKVRRTEVQDSARATQILEPAAGSVQICAAPASDPPNAGARVTAPAAAELRNARPSTARTAPPEPPPHSLPVAEPTMAIRLGANESSTGEARQLAQAIRRLRNDHDARGALALLDMVQRAAGNTFSDEIALVRIEAFLELGDRNAALAALDTLPLPDVPRGEELLVLRGDMRAEAKRWEDAINDYSRGTAVATTQLIERSLFGRANCRMGTGEISLAQADLRDYLQRFPNGRYAADARRMLAR
ncbi:MAG: hypothetical protein JWN44_5677 [Myxococcales bacterium]|nr:hypothetical protein [Myxococcales bacterium]